MSHVHVIINFSYGIDSWNRCLSVHKRLQIRAPARKAGNRLLGSLIGLQIQALNYITLGLYLPHSNLLAGSSLAVEEG